VAPAHQCLNPFICTCEINAVPGVGRLRPSLRQATPLRMPPRRLEGAANPLLFSHSTPSCMKSLPHLLSISLCSASPAPPSHHRRHHRQAVLGSIGGHRRHPLTTPSPFAQEDAMWNRPLVSSSVRHAIEHFYGALATSHPLVASCPAWDPGEGTTSPDFCLPLLPRQSPR
jgi:hypothetical protein